MKTEEGKISLDGHQIWYRRVGNGGIPLLTLHGCLYPAPPYPCGARGVTDRGDEKYSIVDTPMFTYGLPIPSI